MAIVTMIIDTYVWQYFDIFGLENHYDSQEFKNL